MGILDWLVYPAPADAAGARLMELDPKYVDVIVRRWQTWSGEQAVREDDGVTFDDLADA